MRSEKMPRSVGKHGFTYISTWVQECLVIGACFLYLLFQIHPVLNLESQPPVFLIGTGFLSEFLNIPGGLTDWLSALIMQFWFSDFLSALFLTLCFWIVVLLTRKWIETLTGSRRIHTFHLIPAGLLLVLHSQYDFHLSNTLALIINLSFLILFIQWAPKRQAIRAALGLAISVLLYWTTGGAFLMFVILCGLEDLLFRKQIASGLLLLLISAVLPIAGAVSIFLVPLRQAYLHNLTFEYPVKLWIAGYGLPAFYLLTLIIAFAAKYNGIRKPFRRITRLAYIWKWAMGTILLFGGTILLIQKTYDDTLRLTFQVNRSARDCRWSDVLESMQHSPYSNPLLSCQMNLALFETDVILEKMFAYPQIMGTDGLLMNQTWCLAWPEEASNVCWKLGLVNEPLHWAHEALECKGPTPEILKRLGMAYMMKGDNEAANRFFLNLKKVPFQEKTAENLIRLNENPSELALTSEYKYIHSCMPGEDLVSLGKPSLSELDLLLKRNPKNKMAFEYRIAYYLLNGNVKEIWNHISDIGAMTSFKIPRHVQEALMVNAALTPKFDLGQLKKNVLPLNFNRFVEYQQIFRKHGGNKYSAQQDLKIRFVDTYWYYLMFVKPSSMQLDSQNEYHN
jgi:hypothetical protein